MQKEILLSSFPGLVVHTSSLGRAALFPISSVLYFMQRRREDGPYHPTVMNSGDLWGSDKSTK